MVRLAPAIRKVLEQHDVLFSAGGDLFTLSLPSNMEPVPEGLRIIHLDVDPWELGKNYPAEVAILGDPKATLPDVTAILRERMTDAEKARGRERMATASKAILADREALKAKARPDFAKNPGQPETGRA